MQKDNFLLLKKFKITESAKLCGGPRKKGNEKKVTFEAESLKSPERKRNTAMQWHMFRGFIYNKYNP